MDFTKRVQLLNIAFQHIKEAMTLFKEYAYKTPDAECYLYRIDKAVRDLDKETLKELKKECIDNEFKRMTDGLNKPLDNG